MPLGGRVCRSLGEPPAGCPIPPACASPSGPSAPCKVPGVGQEGLGAWAPGVASASGGPTPLVSCPSRRGVGCLLPWSRGAGACDGGAGTTAGSRGGAWLRPGGVPAVPAVGRACMGAALPAPSGFAPSGAAGGPSTAMGRGVPWGSPIAMGRTAGGWPVGRPSWPGAEARRSAEVRECASLPRASPPMTTSTAVECSGEVGNHVRLGVVGGGTAGRVVATAGTPDGICPGVGGWGAMACPAPSEGPGRPSERGGGCDRPCGGPHIGSSMPPAGPATGART